MTTTTLQPEKIEWCPECEIEYAAPQCAPCPLCPLKEALAAASDEVRDGEPWRLLRCVTAVDFQFHVNALEAAGWSLAEFTTGPAHDSEEGAFVYVAFMERRGYSPERHAELFERRERLVDEYRTKRQGIAAEAEEFKRARGDAGSGC